MRPVKSTFPTLFLVGLALVEAQACPLEGFSLATEEERFHRTVDRLEALYAPEVAARGGVLSISRQWGHGFADGYAWRRNADWRIVLYGGATPHPELTEDASALIVCHEIGHHLGGAPLVPEIALSSEGQADYFATAKCLRRLWAHEDNASAIAGLEIPAAVSTACASTPAPALCARSAMAGLSFAKFYKTFVPYVEAEPAPDFSTPDTSTYDPATLAAYPGYQCRLDTFFQGALCPVPAHEAFSDADETIGACHPSRGHTIGNRPACWYLSAL